MVLVPFGLGVGQGMLKYQGLLLYSLHCCGALCKNFIVLSVGTPLMISHFLLVSMLVKHTRRALAIQKQTIKQVWKWHIFLVKHKQKNYASLSRKPLK